MINQIDVRKDSDASITTVICFIEQYRFGKVMEVHSEPDKYVLTVRQTVLEKCRFKNFKRRVEIKEFI